MVDEPERIDSMRSLLHPGDILFDIGAEKGTQSRLYAEIVGARNMCLFEPEPTSWPSIRQALVDPPLRCFVGLVGNETTEPPDVNYSSQTVDGWPLCSRMTPTTTRTFRYIHEHAATTRQVRIDDWVACEDIIPKALAVDVEGAEYLVMLGAGRTLIDHRPLVWLSIHPDLMLKDYNQSHNALLVYMKSLGYEPELLAVDHEHHYLMRPT